MDHNRWLHATQIGPIPGDSEERDSGEGKVERRMTGDREVFRRVWEAQVVGPPQIERNLLGERGDLRRRRKEMSVLDFRDVDRGCIKKVSFQDPNHLALCSPRHLLQLAALSIWTPRSSSFLCFRSMSPPYPHHRVPHRLPGIPSTLRSPLA